MQATGYGCTCSAPTSKRKTHAAVRKQQKDFTPEDSSNRVAEILITPLHETQNGQAQTEQPLCLLLAFNC